MATTSSYSTGIKYGIIGGLMYIILLFLRYTYLGSNPLQLGVSAGLSYLLFIVIMILAVLARRKELGGYADIKDLFQTVFIVILITEICYCVFNFIYLTYIDKEYMNRFIQSTRQWMTDKGLGEDMIEEQMSKIESQKKMTIGKFFLGLGSSVVIDSILGIVIALICRKNKPLNELDSFN